MVGSPSSQSRSRRQFLRDERRPDQEGEVRAVLDHVNAKVVARGMLRKSGLSSSRKRSRLPTPEADPEMNGFNPCSSGISMRPLTVSPSKISPFDAKHWSEARMRAPRNPDTVRDRQRPSRGLHSSEARGLKDDRRAAVSYDLIHLTAVQINQPHPSSPSMYAPAMKKESDPGLPATN